LSYFFVNNTSQLSLIANNEVVNADFNIIIIANNFLYYWPI